MSITIEQAKLLKELSEGKKVPSSRLTANIYLQKHIHTDEPGIHELLQIIKNEHKGLEQEVFNLPNMIE